MSKVLTEKKEAPKSPKKQEKKVEAAVPHIKPTSKPLTLKYYMPGLCPSLKNSQMIIPANRRREEEAKRIMEDIQQLQGKEQSFQEKIPILMKRFDELNMLITKSEERSRKNWLIQCARYARWLQKILPAFRIWMDDQVIKHQLKFPVGHIKLKILFYFPDLNRRDGPNKEQAIFDMLKAVKLVPDDQWIVIDRCSWECSLCRDRPRTEIYITVIDRHRSLWEDRRVGPKRDRKKEKQKRADMLALLADDRLV
jgi:hypothetical protein